MTITNLVVTGIAKILRTTKIGQLVVDNINDVKKEEISALSGVDSNIQEQLDGLGEKLTEASTEQTNFKATIAVAINNIPRNDSALTENSTLEEFTTEIEGIEIGVDTSDATATADHILSGYTAYVNRNKLTGTIVDRTSNAGTVGLAWQGTTTGAPSTLAGPEIMGAQLRIPIPKGYYGSENYSDWDCSGIVVNNFQEKLGIVEDAIMAGKTICSIDGTATSDATATEDHILSGYTAYANGNKVTGSMPNYAGVDVLPRWATINVVSVISDSGIVGINGGGVGHYGTLSFHPTNPGYYDTNSIINQAVFGLHPDVIKAGELIGGNGSKEGVGAIRGTYTSDATATASQILSGYTAYVNGNKLTGTITQVGTDGTKLDSSHYVCMFGSSTDLDNGYIGISTSSPLFLDTDAGIGVANRTMLDAIGLTADKILAGVNVRGLVGTATSDATAVASQILSGYTAYVNGNKLTGTLKDYGYEPSAGSLGTYNGGLYLYVPDINSGSGGQSSGQERGVVQRAIRTPLSNLGTAAASAVLSGNTFTSSAGLKVSGTMANQGAKTATYNPSSSSQTYTIPAGYHNGIGKITFNGLKNILVANGISNIQTYGWVDGNCTLGPSYNKIVTVGVGSSVTITFTFATKPTKTAYNFNNYGILNYNTYNSTAVAQDTSIATTDCSAAYSVTITGVSKGIAFSSRAYKDANRWYVCRFMILVGL